MSDKSDWPIDWVCFVDKPLRTDAQGQIFFEGTLHLWDYTRATLCGREVPREPRYKYVVVYRGGGQMLIDTGKICACDDCLRKLDSHESGGDFEAWKVHTLEAP